MWWYWLYLGGSPQIRVARLEEELAKNGLDKEVNLVVTGCHGLCEMGPLVIVYPEGTMCPRTA